MNGQGTISLCGKDYPCRQTMGALLRFKQETGRDVTEMRGDLSDACVLLWCCVVSASAADGVEFGYSLTDFADRLSPEALTAWVAQYAAPGGEAEGGEKKSR